MAGEPADINGSWSTQEEFNMTEVRQQSIYAGRPGFIGRAESDLPTLIVCLPVAPNATLALQVTGNAEIRAHNAPVWVTRWCSPYDYWIRPGETFSLLRGDRIWVSTDGSSAAEISITMAYISRGGLLGKWFARMRPRGHRSLRLMA